MKNKDEYKVVETKESVRQFFPPGLLNAIQYETCTDYFDMLDFQELEETYGGKYLTEPRATMHLSDEELFEWKNGKNFDLGKYPCHSQDCERAVQNTYKAAEINIGFKKRHQHIIMVDENRKKIKGGANPVSIHK